MKNSFIKITFLVFAITSGIGLSAQKVEFVGKKLNVPKGCEKVSNYEIECGTFSLSWIYMTKASIENILFNQIGQLEKTPDFQYKPVRLLIDSIPSNGFVASFTADHQKYFMLLAAGTVRGQSVLIQGIDLIPFWKYEGHNQVFETLVRLLPDGDHPRMEMNYGDNNVPDPENEKDGE